MRKAYDVAFGLLRDHTAAEETAQDAFVRAYESLHTFRGDAAFATWLYRIVTNLSLNRVKQLQRERQVVDRGQQVPMLEHAGEASWQPDVPEDGLREEIEKALHELPTLQRAVVLLRHFEGLSTKQVSGILRCSEGTVKTHLFRGMEKLRIRLLHVREGDEQ
jgi:RNA polymerase sigma-70 factor (ECF subfamily)